MGHYINNEHVCGVMPSCIERGTILLERLVIVFDTDYARASTVVSVLEGHCASYGLGLLRVDGVRELGEILAKHDVGAVFCDVRSRVSGRDVVEAIRRMIPPGSREQVVYLGVSARNLFVLECGDYAFLLPPNAKAHEIAYALDKALKEHDTRLEKPIVIKTKQRIRKVQPGRVSFAESVLRKVRIHVGGETVEVYGKLSDLKRELPSSFVQCHKSYVVNMGFIKELSQEYVLLSSGERIPVSQKRRKEMREAFLAFVGRSI